jgi:glycerol-3-phosphate dehydrogenase
VTSRWSLEQRRSALDACARDGVELLVVGGGITGAGILRDAALRGLKVSLIERGDFASGTSSHTSKMIHGGLRYIAEGALGVTRESCVERDLLARLNPLLVRPLPFLFCSFDDGVAPWKMLAGLSIYATLAGFQGGGFRLLSKAQIALLSRDVRQTGLRAAGLYHDQQVDDARIVLETIKDARRVGGEAISYCEALRLVPEQGATLVTVRDALSGREMTIRAERVINATGPSVDRVRERERVPAAVETRVSQLGSHAQPRASTRELRPAKGVHVVIARSRVHADAAVSFQAADGRHMFLCPYENVHLIGTTDTFTAELDEPRVTEADVAYLLAATNRTFPSAQLSARDLVSVYAGVRPLVAPADATTPASSVSREHRITEDASGLLSIAGGKLTTYRRMAEQIVDRVVAKLPESRRTSLARCSTHVRPLRDDSFDHGALMAELGARFALAPNTCAALLRRYGSDALGMLESAAASDRAPLSGGRFLGCEVAFSFTHECAASLSDVLERRVRAAVFAEGQGLADLDQSADIAARAAGFDAVAREAEKQAYRARVQTRYRVAPE